jgi:iron complex transport system substrate-binding protein
MELRRSILFLLVCCVTSSPSLAQKRIISVAPNFTEILFAIGAGESVIAVSDYCQYPERAQEKPRIGGPFNLNYELMVALEPDVILMPRSLADPAEKCRSLGLHVLELPNEKVDEVVESIRRLGDVTGRTSEASRLAGRIRGRLDTIAQATRELARRRTLIVVLRAPGDLQDLTAASSETFLNELLWMAGGQNVIGRTLSRYPRVSKEGIVDLDPEVIFDLTFTTEDEDILAVWSALPTLSAVRTGKIVPMPDPSVTIPGPRMVRTLERFLEVIHPEVELPPGVPEKEKP